MAVRLTGLAMKMSQWLAAVAFAIVASSSAHGQTSYYWDSNGSTAGAGATPTGTWGTDNFWNTDSTGGAGGIFVTPTFSTDSLFFSAGTDAVNAYIITLNSTQNARLITFEDGTATLTSGTLNLGVNGGITVTSNTVTGATISSNLTITGSQTFNVADGRTLILDTGTFTRNAGATLNVLSTGTVTSTMTNLNTGSLVNGIVGPWASFGSGASTRYATIDGSNNIVAFTGTTSTVASIGNTPTVNYEVTAVGTLGAGANVNTLRYAGAAGTIAGALTTNGIMNVSGNALVFSGAITSGTGEMVIHSANGGIRITGGLNKSGNMLTIVGSGTTDFGSIGGEGIITGSGGLTKNGTGDLILSGGGTSPLHNFTGGITLNGGTIRFQNSAFLGNGNLHITDGYIGGRTGSGYTWSGLGAGTNQIRITGGTSGFSGEGANNSAFQIGSAGSTLVWGASGEGTATGFFNPTILLLNGTVGMNTNGKGSLNNGINLNGTTRTITSIQTNWDGAVGNGFTISGVISNSVGTAGLIKTGPGNVNLGNANTYNGATTITGGTLTVGNTASLGSGVSSNTLIFNGGSLLANASFNSVVTRGVTMTSTGIINTNTFAVGILGDITGVGGLTKNSTGTLTLSGNNNYAGVTTVNAGTLAITKEVSLASNTAANLNVKNGATLQLNVDSAGTAGFTSTNLSTLLGNISVANTAAQGLQGGANLIIDTSTASGATFTQGNAITNSTGAFGGTIGLTKIGAGILIFDKANTYTGPTTITAGTLQLSDGGAIATAIGNNAAFVTNSAGSLTQGTDFGFIGGTGSVTQSGAGTLTLNLANTYTGTTTVSAGTLALANALAIQNSALVTTTGTSTYSGGAALTIGGLSGSRDLGSADVLFGYTGLVTALTLNPQTGVSVTYSGVISNGSGAMSLTKTGAGTQILTGVNTYTGATIVNAGTLTVGAGGSLDSGSPLQVSGGTFSYGNTAAGQTLNGLTVGAGNATVSNTASGQTLTLGTITRTASVFGTVNFATLTGPISTTTGTTNSIIGPWATTGATTTLRYAVGSPDGSTPTNITAFTTGTTATANTLANVTDATLNYEYSAAVAGMGAGLSLTGNTLRYSGAATGTAINATSTLTLNGLLQAGSGLLTISGGPSTGGILIGSTGELVIAANAQATTISAVIGGTGRLVYSGAGSTLTLGLSAATIITNTYTGGTIINSGTVTILGTANADVNPTLGNASGGITLNGGQLRVTSANISAARIVTVNGTGSSFFLNRNNTFTTTGQLTGAGTLTTLDAGGSGTLATYSFNATTNDFTGRLTGTNTIINVNSFANSANNIVLDGATFNYGTGATAATSLANRAIELSGTTGGATITNSNTTAARTLTIGGGVVITGVGNKTLTLGGVNTGDNTFSGSITDGPGSAISLSKTLAGTWVLSGANTFTGSTTVSAGRLSLNNLNAIANSSSVTVASGGTLGFQLASGGTYNTPVTINIAGVGATLPGGAGALWFGQGGSYSSTLNATINLTAAATIGSFGAAMTQTLAGSITGTGPLTIQSQGGDATHTATWFLNAASTYSGNTIFTASTGGVRDMTVRLGVNNALPITTSLNLQSSNVQNVATFTTFDLNGFDQTLAGLTDTGGSPPTISSVGKRVINSSGTLSTLTINNAGAVTYGTSGTRILAGTIGGVNASGAAANNVALTKTGVGTLTLTGASSFTGDVTISNGTLLASLLSLVTNPTVSPLGNPQTSGRQVLIGSAGTLNFGTSDVMGNSGSTPVLTLVANGGVIRNNGAFFNVLGPVHLNGGTLSSFGGSSAAFPSFYLNGTVTVGGSAVSTISSTGANSQMGLRNAGTTFNVADAVVGSGSDLNVTGVLANYNSIAGSLIKSGPGTMTLSGVNTYTSTTQVNAGTLLVNSPGSLAAASAVTVGGASATPLSTPTLGGTGTINGPLVIATAGAGVAGTLSPGTSAGTLTVNNTVTFGAGSTLFVELDGTIVNTQYDQLVASGTISLGGNAILTGTTGFTILPTDRFFIINNTHATNPIVGMFVSGGTATFGGYNFDVSYVGDFATLDIANGNDVVLYNATLSAVPEPTSLLTVAVISLGVFYRRRRATAAV